MTSRCAVAWKLFMAWCNARKGDDQADALAEYRAHLRQCGHCREWWEAVCAEDDERNN